MGSATLKMPGTPLSSASRTLFHGRIHHIELSASGQALLRRCWDRVHAIESELTAGLSAPEERAVRRWLVGVATADTAET